MKTARHIHIPIDHARHLRMQLRALTAGELLHLREPQRCAIYDIICELTKGLDHVEKGTR